MVCLPKAGFEPGSPASQVVDCTTKLPWQLDQNCADKRGSRQADVLFSHKANLKTQTAVGVFQLRFRQTSEKINWSARDRQCDWLGGPGFKAATNYTHWRCHRASQCQRSGYGALRNPSQLPVCQCAGHRRRPWVSDHESWRELDSERCRRD